MGGVVVVTIMESFVLSGGELGPVAAFFGSGPSSADAQFFVADPACRLQLRPLVRSDLPPWQTTTKANAVLALRNERGEPEGYVQIRIAPHLIRNSRSGVMAALDRVQEKAPGKAPMLRAIAESQTVWGEADAGEPSASVGAEPPRRSRVREEPPQLSKQKLRRQHIAKLKHRARLRKT